MSGLYEVSWPEYSSNRTSCLSELLKRNVFIDVTLVFDDNEQVSAHKVILSSASSFFQNILEKNPHPNPMIYLKGMTRKLFISLLDFIYLGEVSLPESDFDTFISMARDLKIKGLLNEAQENDTMKKASGKNKNSSIKKKQKKLSLIENTPPVLKNNTDDSLSSETLDDPDPTHYDDLGSSAIEEKSEEKVIKMEEQYKIKKKEVKQTLVKKELVRDLPNKSPEMSGTGKYDHMNPVSAEIYAKINALLITTSEGFWVCNECRYGSMSKANVMEHIEMHIEGIIHKCKNCSRTFTKKTALSNHFNKCMAPKFAQQ